MNETVVVVMSIDNDPNICLQVSPEIFKETDRNESGDVALTSLASNFDKTIAELDKNVTKLTVQLRASI